MSYIFESILFFSSKFLSSITLISSIDWYLLLTSIFSSLLSISWDSITSSSLYELSIFSIIEELLLSLFTVLFEWPKVSLPIISILYLTSTLSISESIISLSLS